MANLSRFNRSGRGGQGQPAALSPVEALVQRLELPPQPSLDDLSHVVEGLYGRPLRFKEISGTGLQLTTGVVFDAPTFTGVMVPAEDSAYYSLLSRVHELCHLVVRSAPEAWFSAELSRPRQPEQHSRLFLRICPRNSNEAVDAETVREEVLVENMARALMRRLGAFQDSTEEDHFA